MLCHAFRCRIGKRCSLRTGLLNPAVQKGNSVSCLPRFSSAVPCCEFIRTFQKQALRPADYALNCAAISETMFRHAVIIFIKILLGNNFF
jgi:hypothetical protein